MPRRIALAALTATVLALAGCGGSTGSTGSKSSTSAPASTSATASTGATAPTSATASDTVTATVSAGPTTSAASTTASEVPKNKAPRRSKATKPDTNVRIPAAFVIGAGGAVTPPQIALPPNVRIELHLANHDSHGHTITVSVPNVTAISVPAGGAKTTEMTGVAKGTYTLRIDGAPKAKLVVGVVPGP